MLYPIRCYTCNKILGQFHSIENWTQDKFKTHDIHRYCCKKILLHHVDVYQHNSNFKGTDTIKNKSHLEVTRMVIPR
jgi:DNA-directed RNA polymerase subunit N (RpoN/RPB10)